MLCLHIYIYPAFLLISLLQSLLLIPSKYVCLYVCVCFFISSETRVWNERLRSRIQAVEMSYLRGACGVQKMDGESNESV